MRAKDTMAENDEMVLALLDSFEYDPEELIAAYENLNKQLNDRPDAVHKLLKSHSSNLVDACLAHLKQTDNVILKRKSIQLLGVILYLPDLNITNEKASQIMEDLIETVESSSDPNVIIRCLWCFIKQQLPDNAFKLKLAHVLKSLKMARTKKELQTSQLNGEYLSFIHHCVDKLGEEMGRNVLEWVPSIVQLTMDSNSKHRDKAVVALEKLITIRNNYPTITPDIGKLLKNDIKGTIAPYLQQQLKKKEEISALKLWCALITLLGETIHVGSSILNSLLCIAEACFKSPEPSVKMATFNAWKVLVSNFSINLNVLSSPARLKLLIQPLVHVSASTEQLALAKFDTWWTLCVGLKHKLEDNFALVMAPLLRFIVGGTYMEIDVPSLTTTPTKKPLNLNDSFQSPSTPSSPKLYHLKLGDAPKSISVRPLPVFPGLQAKLGFVLQQILLSHKSNSEFENLSLSPVQNWQTLANFGHLFVQCLRIWISKCENPAEYHKTSLSCWSGLSNLISTKIEQMGGEEKSLLIESVLLQFKAFVNEAPLIDAHCLIETYNAFLPGLVGKIELISFENSDINDSSPACFIMSVLLLKLEDMQVLDSDTPMLCSIISNLTKSIFNTPQVKLLDSFEGFVSSFGEISQKFNYTVRLAFWENIKKEFMKFLRTSNEVNQGSPTEHNFVCAFEVLSYPILFCDSLQSVSEIQKLATEWSGLFEEVNRCICLATTTDQNSCTAEFCSVLNRNSSLDFSNPATLLLTTEALQTMGGCLNFEEAKLQHDERLNNKRSPMKWCKNDGLQPLGPLTSYVMLLKSCSKSLIEMKNEDKTEVFGVPIVGNILTCTSRMFDKVDWSAAQITLAEMLVPSIAQTLQDASLNSSKIKWNSRGVLGWLDACYGSMCKGLVKHYGGPYDDVCLDKVAPVIIIGLTSTRTAVRSETVSFWQSTFGTSTLNLKYPEQLRETLMKIKGKLILSTPGLENVFPPRGHSDKTTDDDVTMPVHDTDDVVPMPVNESDDQFSFDLDEASSPKSNGGLLALKSDDEELTDKEEDANVTNGKPTIEETDARSGPQKRKRAEEEDEESLLFVPPQEKKVMRLTEHQKEKLGNRDEMAFLGVEESQDVPAAPPPDFIMESQDALSMSATEITSVESNMNGNNKKGKARKSVQTKSEEQKNKLSNGVSTKNRMSHELEGSNMSPVVLLENIDLEKLNEGSTVTNGNGFNTELDEGVPLNKIAKLESGNEESLEDLIDLNTPKADTDQKVKGTKGRKTRTPKKATVKEPAKKTSSTRGGRRVSSNSHKDLQITVSSASTTSSSANDVVFFDDPSMGNEFTSLHSLDNKDNGDQSVEFVDDFGQTEQVEKEWTVEDEVIAQNCLMQEDEIKALETEERESKEKENNEQIVPSEPSQVAALARVSSEVLGSPGGILKKRLDAMSASPLTPNSLNKHRHVHFAEEDGYVSDHVIDSLSPQKRSTPTLEPRAVDDASVSRLTPKSRVSPGFSRNFQRRTLQMVRQAAAATGTVIQEKDEDEEKESDVLDDYAVPPSPQIVRHSTHPVYPSLTECTRPIKELIPLISTAMQTGLLNVLSAKKVVTIGDLASKSESYIMQLPVRPPKIKTVKEAFKTIEEKIAPAESVIAEDVIEAETENVILDNLVEESVTVVRNVSLEEEMVPVPVPVTHNNTPQADSGDGGVPTPPMQENIALEDSAIKTPVIKEIHSALVQNEHTNSYIVHEQTEDKQEECPPPVDEKMDDEDTAKPDGIQVCMQSFESALNDLLNLDVVDMTRLQEVWGRINLWQTTVVNTLFQEKSTF